MLLLTCYNVTLFVVICMYLYEVPRITCDNDLYIKIVLIYCNHIIREALGC
jgi:hypothetical protein